MTKDKMLYFRIQQPLFVEFRKAAEANYKTVSEALRQLMVEYIKRQRDE